MNYLNSIFDSVSNISTYVSNSLPSISQTTSNQLVEYDPIVNSVKEYIQFNQILTPACVLRSDKDFYPKEYYIDYHFNLDTMLSFISTTLNSQNEKWKIRLWNMSNYQPSQQECLTNCYIIELTELSTLIGKKFWFFNLSVYQVNQLNLINQYYLRYI